MACSAFPRLAPLAVALAALGPSVAAAAAANASASEGAAPGGAAAPAPRLQEATGETFRLQEAGNEAALPTICDAKTWCIDIQRSCTSMADCGACAKTAAVGCCVARACASAPNDQYYSCRNKAYPACQGTVAFDEGAGGAAAVGLEQGAAAAPALPQGGTSMELVLSSPQICDAKTWCIDIQRSCTSMANCGACARAAAVGCCVAKACASAPDDQYYSCRNKAYPACQGAAALAADYEGAAADETAAAPAPQDNSTSLVPPATELVRTFPSAYCDAKTWCIDIQRMCTTMADCACAKTAAVGCCVEKTCASAPDDQYYTCRNKAYPMCKAGAALAAVPEGAAENGNVTTVLTQLVRGSPPICDAKTWCIDTQRSCTSMADCGACLKTAAVGCCVAKACASAADDEYYSCRNKAFPACQTRRMLRGGA